MAQAPTTELGCSPREESAQATLPAYAGSGGSTGMTAWLDDVLGADPQCWRYEVRAYRRWTPTLGARLHFGPWWDRPDLASSFFGRLGRLMAGHDVARAEPVVGRMRRRGGELVRSRGLVPAGRGQLGPQRAG